MSREPTRLVDLQDEAPSREAAFLRAVIRAQEGARPPSGKMEELAGRLGPLLQSTTTPAPSHGIPWMAASAAAIVALGFVAVVRTSTPTPKLEAPVQTSVASTAKEVSPPPSPVEPDPPAAVPVDALPSVNVQKAPPVPGAAPRCDEVVLLDIADTELRSGNPERALAATRDLEQRCAGGALVQERERIAIEALAKLGRIDQARARARAFEARFPTSAHLRRVRQVVE
jgi:hypothetical protein